MWKLSNDVQIISFLVAVIFGVIYCVYYDIFRSIRAAGFNSPVTVFLQDILFFLPVAVVTFLLMLVYSNGEIRFYILFGILTGFLIFNFTLSRFLRYGITFIIKKTTALLRLMKRVLRRFFDKISRVVGSALNNLKKFYKKTDKTLKNLLKRGR